MFGKSLSHAPASVETKKTEKRIGRVEFTLLGKQKTSMSIAFTTLQRGLRLAVGLVLGLGVRVKVIVMWHIRVTVRGRVWVTPRRQPRA